jgi:hypothetical protein
VKFLTRIHADKRGYKKKLLALSAFSALIRVKGFCQVPNDATKIVSS